MVTKAVAGRLGESFFATNMIPFLVFLGVTQISLVSAINSLDVDTSSGPVQGFTDNITPNVAQFFGIPFTEQPVGARRWLPPTQKSKANKTLKATDLGPACPQFEGNAENVWLTDAPEKNV
jgi:acetylcholinesterase